MFDWKLNNWFTHELILCFFYSSLYRCLMQKFLKFQSPTIRACTDIRGFTFSSEVKNIVHQTNIHTFRTIGIHAQWWMKNVNNFYVNENNRFLRNFKPRLFYSKLLLTANVTIRLTWLDFFVLIVQFIVVKTTFFSLNSCSGKI